MIEGPGAFVALLSRRDVSTNSDRIKIIIDGYLDRRTGIPLTLCIVYMEIGRRCGLQVDGVGFPGHFLCKVHLGGGDLVIDPFHRGQLLGFEELKKRLVTAVGDQVKLRLVNEMNSDHPMPHPFHVHGAGRFLILARDDVVEPNLVWKDTVLVRTGETVDILLDVTNVGRLGTEFTANRVRECLD